jgi:hypothetical protein
MTRIFALRKAVFLSLALSSHVFCAEPDATQYPHKLAEIKAMVQLLSPRKGVRESVQNEYLKRLKTYRYLCGVPFETLQWDDKLADLAAHASLVCSKLNKLTHTPEKPAGMNDADYQLGKTGAGQSNLFEGVTNPLGCVDGWMDDSDATNIDRVGHRRWCLSPHLQNTGFGSSGKFAAMHCFDQSNKVVPEWDFITYPARGYMPAEFFAPRSAWSVSPNPGKYDLKAGNIKVAIHAADARLAPTGEALKLDYSHVDLGGYGSGPAIIFRPEGNAPREGVFVVDISGLKKKAGGDAEIHYVVHFVNLQKVPASADGAAVYSKYFQQRLTAVQAIADKVDRAEALSDLSEEEYLQYAEASVAAAVRKSLAELTHDPAISRELEANQRYKQVAEAETKAGKVKTQRLQVATAYRDLSLAYKETRAGKKAGEDFERLKKEL